MNPSQSDNAQKKLTSIIKPVLFGFGALAIFLAGFGYWSVSAPLTGAVVASGWVAKQGDTQTVSHERGGVVAAISVREGDEVKQGDLLISIKDADRKANHDELTVRIAALEVRELRLMAEDDLQERFDPAQMMAAMKAIPALSRWDDEIEAMFRDQIREFQSRRQYRVQERAILDAERRTLKQDLIGVRARIISTESWMSILKDQRDARQGLLDQGHGRRLDLQETLKDLAEVEGEYAQLQARKTMLPSQIEGIRARLQNVEHAFLENVRKELSELRATKLAMIQQLKAAETAIARVEVRAPTSGFINKIHVNTIGSAIGAFQPIVEIVPENNPALVEVEINPADIEQVKIGQDARLILSAYDPNEVAPVHGTVKFVSPDRRMNERTQMPYFVARLEMDMSGDNMPEISPGMPVEAYMTTTKRTFAEILFDPITKSLRRAFRS